MAGLRSQKTRIGVSKKTEWALQRGGRSAHSFSWLLSSPQQPLETEDPPTVSLAPQYTSQHLCRAIIIFLHGEMHEKRAFLPDQNDLVRAGVQLFHGQPGKKFSIIRSYTKSCSKMRLTMNRPMSSGLGSPYFRSDRFGQGVSLRLDLAFTLSFDHHACQRLGAGVPQ